ncbi:MAG: GNAT family N-acetyltransferase [Halanaerobium sp.]|nr:GNAT family N-acetyltransferase [Halanaerobium sp.]
MKITVKEGGRELLERYSRLPIAFMAKSYYQHELVDGGLGGIKLTENRIHSPYIIDHDANESPLDWPNKFALTNWRIFLAYKDNCLAGGAAVACRTKGMNILAGRNDISVLWDLRVHPGFRGQGVGPGLFQSAVKWSEGKGLKFMKIETQNTNPTACKFYQGQGCLLGEINLQAYPGQDTDEVMLVWYYPLGGTG